MQSTIDINALRDLTSNRTGVVDVACPCCGPDRRTPSNRVRKVMRVWNDGDGFITYNCERCGEAGYATDKQGGRTEKPRRDSMPVPQPDPVDKIELARTLWSQSLPSPGTLVETYLRSRHCWVESDAIRYLPGRGRHGPTMIARFGEGELTGVHLTRLARDGSGNAGTDKDKIMLGPTKGQPIIVHDNPERLDLFVSEGVEDAASIAIATGLTCWAAGSATRIRHLMPLTAAFEHVFIAVDDDFAGRRALQCASEIRPDAIALDFGAADANATLSTRGPDAITEAIDMAFFNHRSGETFQIAA